MLPTVQTRYRVSGKGQLKEQGGSLVSKGLKLPSAPPCRGGYAMILPTTHKKRCWAVGVDSKFEQNDVVFFFIRNAVVIYL